VSTLLQNTKAHEEEYLEFLRNKSVAVVGPAASSTFQENGQKIDSFDVVVRVNRGMELVKENKLFIGSKTDVLYNSLDFSPLVGGNLYQDNLENIEFICCPYPIKSRTFQNHIFSNMPNRNESLFEKYKIRFISEGLYAHAVEETNSRINSGFGAILDILDNSPKSLFITGLDFYRSTYHPKYNARRKWGSDYKKIEEDLEFKLFNDSSRHNPDRQYKYFKRMLKKHEDVIELDGFMSSIINDCRYDNWDTIPREENL
jgi:hypothetical protein